MTYILTDAEHLVADVKHLIQEEEPARCPEGICDGSGKVGGVMPWDSERDCPCAL